MAPMYHPGRAALALLLVVACERSTPSPAAVALDPAPIHREPLSAVPASLERNAKRAALGEKLFFDRALSSNEQVACVDCHLFEHGGADTEPLSPMFGGARTRFNSPSIFNVALNFRFSWTGAFSTMEAQLDEAFVRTMGVNIAGAAERLKNTPYAAEFAAAYPGGLDPTSLRDALAVYVSSLVTPNARFDRWLAGDAAALSQEEQQGYLLFKELGCASCHQGANVGGNLFQRMGIAENYFATRKQPLSEADRGRESVTNDPADRHVFRVPSLRNVERTAPYFHDGSAGTLDDAIAVMARFQLGRDVPPEDRQRIAAFLRTLSGEVPSASEAAAGKVQ
jgi:cytochrome c peroxidase